MQITDVRVRKVNSQNRMKAIASITFDDVFVVHDIKVIESDKGLFIAMPSRKTPNGEFKDIAHPISTETREMIQAAILAKYAELPDLEEAPDAEAVAPVAAVPVAEAPEAVAPVVEAPVEEAFDPEESLV